MRRREGIGEQERRGEERKEKGKVWGREGKGRKRGERKRREGKRGKEKKGNWKGLEERGRRGEGNGGTEKRGQGKEIRDGRVHLAGRKTAEYAHFTNFKIWELLS